MPFSVSVGEISEKQRSCQTSYIGSIVRQKVGDKIYLYESTSYRNAEGKPRTKRVLIGKLDPVTGNPVYKPDYRIRMVNSGAAIAIPSSNATFTVDSIRNSSIKEYGAFYLFDSIAQKIGLQASIKEAIPRYWQELFVLACYLVSSGDPFLYCENWVSNTECPPVGNLSSQRISELLAAVTSKDRERFYQVWCKIRSEQ